MKAKEKPLKLYGKLDALLKAALQPTEKQERKARIKAKAKKKKG